MSGETPDKPTADAPKADLTPWDLEVDAGPPSQTEDVVCRASTVCLVAGGLALALLVAFGVIAEIWEAGVPHQVLILFVGVPLLVGCLLLQIGSSMSHKREDDARKAAWDEYSRSQQASDWAAEESAGGADDSQSPGDPPRPGDGPS